MRVFLIAVVVLVGAVVGGAALLPMSMAADLATNRFPDFKFSKASGSVWDGKLTQVSYGEQFIGDLTAKTDLMGVLGGKAGGVLSLSREGFTGQTDLSFGLFGGGMEMKDLTLEGNTALVPGMPAALADKDGRFSLQVKDVKFVDNLCESATGEVWTDTLAKVNVRGWVGPELRGPVTCKDGNLNVEARGKAATGEDVLATLTISQHLDMNLETTISNASPAAFAALADVGFVRDGDKLVLRQEMGGR